MNKLFGLSLLLVLFTAGCGKKKDAVKKIDSKKMAALDKNLPVFTSDKEELVDNESMNDFAFIDDEDLAGDANLVVSAEDLERSSKDKAKALADASAGSNELLATTDEAALDNELGFKRVQFNFNENAIRKDQLNVVAADVEAAKKAVEQGKTVIVKGHTCQMGPAAYNMALSQNRAEAVKKQMVHAGIESDLVKTVGYGYEQPLVWSDATERAVRIQELSANRRAEVSVD